MAKLETETVKKAKGKKRKHNNAENEDEIANKSVIVERHDEQDEPVQTNSSPEVEQRKNNFSVYLINTISI